MSLFLHRTIVVSERTVAGIHVGRKRKEWLRRRMRSNTARPPRLAGLAALHAIKTIDRGSSVAAVMRIDDRECIYMLDSEGRSLPGVFEQSALQWNLPQQFTLLSQR
jgi:hypothetical protein